MQGQEVLSERTEPPDFQALPQPTPETPEPGLEMPPGATEQSTLGLLVKEESEVTEEPGKGRRCALCFGGPRIPPSQWWPFSPVGQACHSCGSFFTLSVSPSPIHYLGMHAQELRYV